MTAMILIVLSIICFLMAEDLFARRRSRKTMASKCDVEEMGRKIIEEFRKTPGPAQLKKMAGDLSVSTDNLEEAVKKHGGAGKKS